MEAERVDAGGGNSYVNERRTMVSWMDGWGGGVFRTGVRWEACWFKAISMATGIEADQTGTRWSAPAGT